MRFGMLIGAYAVAAMLSAASLLVGAEIHVHHSLLLLHLPLLLRLVGFVAALVYQEADDHGEVVFVDVVACSDHRCVLLELREDLVEVCVLDVIAGSEH